MMETGQGGSPKRSSLFPPNEDTNPCSIAAMMKRVARDKSKHLKLFLNDLDIYGGILPVPAAHLPVSVELFSDLKNEKRAVVWCPPRLSIIDHVNAFLISRAHMRGVDIAPGSSSFGAHLISKALERTLSDPAWMISWALPNSGDESKTHGQSGVYRAERFLPAQHLAYLVAWSIYHRIPVPFASTDRGDLRFVKTDTEASGGYLLMAYVPGDAIYFKLSQEGSSDGESLQPADVIPIVLARP